MDYKVKDKLTTGTYTNVYLCEDNKLLKVIRDADNYGKLADQEAKIITKLRESELADFFPELLDAGEVRMSELGACDDCPKRFVCYTTTGIRSHCDVSSEGLLYTYKEMPSLVGVMNAYPKGIDEKDMVWMFKRLLAALWIAHSENVVHSAVLPEHVFLNLKDHGICLIDWMHAVHKDKYVSGYVKIADDSFYPSFAINNPTALDIYMAATCMIKLVGGIDNVDKEIRLILRACLNGAADARYVHEQLDKVVKKLWGSVFRPFKV